MVFTKYKKIFFLSLILIFQFYLVKILSGNLLFVNKVYPYFFSILNLVQRKLFSIFSFDIGNLLYIFFTLFIIYFLFKSIRLKKIFSSILIVFNSIFFLFFLTWGFNYYNKEIENKYLLEETSNKKLIKFTEYLYNKTIFYSKYSKRNAINNYQISNLKNLYTEVLKAQTKTKILSTKAINNETNTKPSIFSEYFSYSGIGGVYNPFTAEAIYNKSMPDIKLPFTISHEMSHQIGFASEAEANFVGFLVGTNINNNSIKYAIYYTALKYAMVCLSQRDPILYPFYLSRFNNKMRKDYKQEKEYFLKYDSEVEIYISYSNDIFLKLNNQKDGINSYQKFIYMLINYYKV